MPETPSTLANGVATVPKRTPAYYRFAWAAVTANGVTTNRLASPIIYSTGQTQSINNVEGWDTWAEVLTRLTALAIPYTLTGPHPLSDPALPKA